MDRVHEGAGRASTRTPWPPLNNLGIYHWGAGTAEEAEAVLPQVLAADAGRARRRAPAHPVRVHATWPTLLADRGDLEEAWSWSSGRGRAARGAGRAPPRDPGDGLQHARSRWARWAARRRRARLRAEALAELPRLLGEEHPLTRIARDERRVYRDLEPLAV